MGGKSSGSQVSVVDYTMSMHYGVAISADSLTGIYAQLKTVWEGSVDVNCIVNINNPSLFGGPKQQGGMVGQAHVMFGADDQIAPAALATRLALTPETCPAFRGLLTILFCSDAGGGFHFQFNNPSMPPLSFKLQRTPVAPALDPTYASIPARGAAANRLVSAGFNDNLIDPDTGLAITITGTGPTYGPTIPDANPAHIIYELLTDQDWGMGLDPANIETTTFQACAVTLFTENLGLSIIWTSQDTIDALVTQILGTIQASLYIRPSTGKFELKLFRADYWFATSGGGSVFNGAGDINQLNGTLTSFSRKMPGELANEVVVDWTNPLTEQTESVTVQDPGAIANQNGIISQRSTYPGVRNELLAAELAARDLAAVGAPLSVIEASVDRSLWNLVPGDVMTVTYPEYGLTGLICRIIKIDYGKPGDAAMKVNLVEDSFAGGTSSYVVAQPPVWTDPKLPPGPATLVLPLTLPMYVLLNLGDSGVAAAREFPDVTVGMIAAPPVSNASAFDLIGETVDGLGNVTDTNLGTKAFMAHGVTNAALPAAAITGSFETGTLVGNPTLPVGAFIILGATDRTMEIMCISSIDTTLHTVTVERGLFDTIPRDWPAGTGFFLINSNTRIDDPTGRAADDTFDYKLLTIAGGGQLDPSLAPIVEFTPTERPFLPNRPGNVAVGATSFGSLNWLSDDDILVTWANRNRLTEESRIVLWSDADLPPEDGQTTSIVVWPEDLSAPLTTHDSLTGTSFSLPLASFAADTSGFVQVIAKRDGLSSLQGLMIHVGLSGSPVTGAGWGFDWGDNYGGGPGGDGDDWIVIPNNSDITIDGLVFVALNADTTHSALYSASLGEYKFEVLNGENWQGVPPVAWDDPPQTMRSELYGPAFAFDAVASFSYGVTVLHGQEPTTNQWFIIGQIHVGAFVGTGGSPPIALDVRPDGMGGEKLQCDYNFQPTGTTTITYTNLGSMPGFTRGVRYFIEWVYKDDHGGPNGIIKLTINGTVIINFVGVTGYSSSTSGSYPKLGIYTGGNGSSGTDLPIAGQDITAIYDSVAFSVAAVVADAIYISSTGSDSATGVRAAPVRTPMRAKALMDASGGVQDTVYFMAGTYSVSAWPTGSNETWAPDPTDPAYSVTINATAGLFGNTGSGTSNITIRDMIINGTAATTDPVFEFAPVTGLNFLGIKGTMTSTQAMLLVYNPQNCFIQGFDLEAPSDNGNNMIGIVINDSVPHSNVTVAGKIRGCGRFPIECQNQHNEPLHDFHFDYLDVADWDVLGTTSAGAIGISWVGAKSTSNTNCTLFGGTFAQAPGNTIANLYAIEIDVWGVTIQNNTIENCTDAILIGKAGLILDNTITGAVNSFVDDGGGSYDETSVEIGLNNINGVAVTGCTGPGLCALTPAPSASGLTPNTPSAPYVP